MSALRPILAWKPKTNGPPRRCVKFECNGYMLRYLRYGQSLQTNNGFRIAAKAGWICPNCGGNY